jgi:hypothetical protein
MQNLQSIIYNKRQPQNSHGCSPNETSNSHDARGPNGDDGIKDGGADGSEDIIG